MLTQGRSTTTLSAQVSASGTLYNVGYSMLRGGLYDAAGVLGYGGTLVDDGTNGDARAGDGLFTNAGVRTDCCSVTGDRTVRIMAEVHAGDGKRHATAVDIAPFAVLDQAPSPGSTLPIPPTPTPIPLNPPGTTTGSTTGGTTSGGTTTGGTTTGATGSTGGTPGGTTGGTTTGGGTGSIDLTGFWQDDGGTLYRIRQLGSDVYWSMEDLPRVTNVFVGKLDSSGIGEHAHRTMGGPAGRTAPE